MIGSVVGDPINVVSDTADTAFRQVLDDLKSSMDAEPSKAFSSYLLLLAQHPCFKLLSPTSTPSRRRRSATKTARPAAGGILGEGLTGLEGDLAISSLADEQTGQQTVV